MKKDLEDNAHKLRELEKEMQASFSGPLVSWGMSWECWVGLP